MITFVLYYGKEEWKRPLSILDMLDLDEEEKKELEPFLLNHKIHLISLSRLDEKEVEKYKSDFWHVIKFLTLHGYGKTCKYLEEESGKRKLKHPEEVQNVLYALSSDKRFLAAGIQACSQFSYSHFPFKKKFSFHLQTYPKSYIIPSLTLVRL